MRTIKVVDTTGIYKVGFNQENAQENHEATYIVEDPEGNTEKYELDLQMGDYIPTEIAEDAIENIKEEYTEILGLIVTEEYLLGFKMVLGDEYDLYLM